MIAARIVLMALFIAGAAQSQWVADPGHEKQVAAANAIQQIRDRIPRSEPFFEEAYGFAVFPSVTRIGLGIGGATGRGFVIEGDTIIGTTRFSQFTSGIQAGARNFSMVVMFKDKAALEYYKTGKAQFMGQAGLAAGKSGIAGTPAFNAGVAIFTVTRFGVMAEFTISGARFSFRPSAVE